MIEIGFRDLKEAADDIRNKQAVRYTYYLSASIPVQNNKSAKAVLAADQDADIQITHITASVIAPSDISGYRLTSQGTDFPLPGSPSGYAERGLTLNVYAGSNKNLQLSDPTIFKTAVPPYTEHGFNFDCKTILQPGYLPGQFSRPVPFDYYLKVGDKLTFQFFNRDTKIGDVDESPINLYHFVTLTLTCKKLEAFSSL